MLAKFKQNTNRKRQIPTFLIESAYAEAQKPNNSFVHSFCSYWALLGLAR
jgi:hypothetical protein